MKLISPRFFRLVLFATLFFLPNLYVCGANSWPEWRGSNHQGNSTATNIPSEWSETQNIAWRTPIKGRGWSTPVIANGRVWVTTAVDVPASKADAERRRKASTNSQPLLISDSVSMRAIELDLESGKQLRDIEVISRELPQPIHIDNSYATPSPIIDGDRLYCHFGPNGCACVDMTSGEVVWRQLELEVAHENGAGSSPVLWRDFLFIHCDGIDTQYIVGLNKGTGEIAWKTPRTGKLHPNVQLQKSYATPLMTEVNGESILVSPAADWVYGYEPQSGKELWRLKYGELGFSNSARPVFGHGLLYICTGYMKSRLLALKHAGSKEPSIVWRHTKQVPAVACPLVVGNELYFASDNGVASCLDARTGKVHWTKRIGKRFWASPVYCDGRIYFFDRAGTTTVVAASKEFRHIADNTLDGSLFSSAAIVDDSLIMRTEKAVYSIRN